ncbi:MAG: mechanosensitive ion channel family protein, partial [Kofleriaceae bacterium]
RTGPWGIAYWQWIGAVTALALAVIGGRLVAKLIMWLAGRITARTDSTWDDEAVARLGRPIRFTGCIVAARLFLPVLELSARIDAATKEVLLAAFGVGVVWCVVRLVDVVVAHLAVAPWVVARPASRGLLTLAGRIVKFVLVVFATIGFLGALGLPVASLIAGVGVGGIALAFGAKQTVENLFGAFALGVDQPLREGDFVRTDGGVLGTVESVGLRSTRIRTLDRTVVSMPNGRLADSRIETFGLRDRCRLHTTLRVGYATTAAQLREILAGLEGGLRADPRTYLDELVVKLAKLGEHSFEIEIQSWYNGSEYARFREWRQDMLLRFVEVIEGAGSSIAYSTQTVHLAGEPAADRS